MFSMMLIVTLILGVSTSALGFIFAENVAQLLGADSELLPYCVTYARTCLIFNTMFMLQNVFQSFLVTAERPKMGLAVVIAAGCTNMLLDFLFIAVFELDVVGAALATGLSQTVGGLLPLIFFLRRNNGSKLHMVRTRLEFRPILQACANGASELMTSISSSIVSMLYNFQLLRLAGQDGVSAYGVLMYVQFIFAAVYIGYAIGTAPITGYNYGAQNHAELKNIRRKSIKVTLTAGVIMVIIAELLAPVLAGIFVGYDKDLFGMTVHAFRLFSFTFLLSGFNIWCSSFFTALGDGVTSALISFLRTMLFQVIAIIVLPMLLDIDGIWLAITAAELAALAVSVAMFITKDKVFHYRKA